MQLTLNNTPMSYLYYSPMGDEYHYVSPGKCYDDLPEDAEFVQALHNEQFLVYAAQAYNMVVTGVFLQPLGIVQ